MYQALNLNNHKITELREPFEAIFLLAKYFMTVFLQNIFILLPHKNEQVVGYE